MGDAPGNLRGLPGQPTLDCPGLRTFLWVGIKERG